MLKGNSGEKEFPVEKASFSLSHVIMVDVIFGAPGLLLRESSKSQIFL